jgi:tRNA(fMet)-specific endonuclease VapC
MILLDTDTLSLFMDGQERVTERVREEGAIAISVITQIEILQGRFASVLKAADAEQLLRAQERLEKSEKFLRSVTIVAIDTASAAEFDKLRQNKKLKKLGRGDLLIASIALGNRATLVTRNLKHFQQVTGLKVENWAD